MIRHNDITIDSRNKIIRHRDARILYKPYGRNPKKKSVRFLLLKYLILGWHDIQELFDLLYHDQDDGGPDGGPHVVQILMNQARTDMRRLGLLLVWRKDGRNFRQYHLNPVTKGVS